MAAGLSNDVLQWRPRPDSKSHVQYIYLFDELCPVVASSEATRNALNTERVS